MDYAHDQLWQLLPSGPVPLNFDILPPGETRTPLFQHLGDESEPYHLERNLAAMVAEGCHLAQQPGLQLPIAPTQYTELQRHQAIRETPDSQSTCELWVLERFGSQHSRQVGGHVDRRNGRVPRELFIGSVTWQGVT